jgi:hypothetical protein
MQTLQTPEIFIKDEPKNLHSPLLDKKITLETETIEDFLSPEKEPQIPAMKVNIV